MTNLLTPQVETGVQLQGMGCALTMPPHKLWPWIGHC